VAVDATLDGSRKRDAKRVLQVQCKNDPFDKTITWLQPHSGVSMKKIFRSDKPNTFHYITMVSNSRYPVFDEDEYCRILADIVEEIRILHPFKLVGYVFMPDHAHMLINPLKPELSIIMNKVKGKSAKMILDQLKADGKKMSLKQLKLNDVKGRSHAIWQKKSSMVDVVTSRFLQQKLNYIHQNPVRAGLCSDPIEWKWSSYRAYLPGFEGAVPIRIDWPSHWTKVELESVGLKWNEDH
jgi:putative transposase